MHGRHRHTQPRCRTRHVATFDTVVRPRLARIRTHVGTDGNRNPLAGRQYDGKTQLVAPGEAPIAEQIHIAESAYRERHGDGDLFAWKEHVIAPLAAQRAGYLG